jgi:hypothetical protein
VLIVIAICFAVPLAWLLLASFDPSATLSAKVPSQFTLDNFTAVLTPEISFVPLANSLIVSGGCALVTVVVAILAAYPLSRYRMRINKPFLYGILFGTGLPITAMMVPVYSLFVSLNLIDSIGGTVFFLAATSLPMAIWMAKNFMDSVPISLEEAAWTDGASMFSTLTRIVVHPGLGELLRAVRAAAQPRQATRGREHLQLLRAVRLGGLRPARGVLDRLLGARHRVVRARLADPRRLERAGRRREGVTRLPTSASHALAIHRTTRPTARRGAPVRRLIPCTTTPSSSRPASTASSATASHRRSTAVPCR